MKSYIKLVEQLRANLEKDSVKHRSAADEAQQKLNALKEKRAKAIADGNQAEYKSLCQDIEYYELRVKHEIANAENKDIPAVELHRAWREYRKDYDSEYDKLTKEYVKQRAKLVEAYTKVLEFMNEGNKEKRSYMDDAHLTTDFDPELRMNATFPEYKPNAHYRLSADGILLTVDSDDPWRVAENASYIENGSYMEGGINGETIYEMMYKHKPIIKSDDGRVLWEENGKSEYITRREMVRRKVAALPAAERRAWEKMHGQNS